jgi:hypothetical protein
MAPNSVSGVKVLEDKEAVFKNKEIYLPANEQCTLGCREGALPIDVEVIPDTALYYPSESHIVDLYTVQVGSEEVPSVPFMHGVVLKGPQGEQVRIHSVSDDGAMVNAIDSAFYAMISGCHSAFIPSIRLLHMANGGKWAHCSLNWCLGGRS